MKTGLDMVIDGFGILNELNLTTVITGNLYMLERPKNSELEDVVVNGLPITNDQIQRGVFNVNVHVPNLKNVVIDGKADETQPDIIRLNGLTKIVMDKINYVRGNDFHFEASTSGQPIRDADLTWYMNIRVQYSAFQNNFKNI